MPSHMKPLNNSFVSLFAVLASILQEIYRFVKMGKENENDHIVYIFVFFYRYFTDYLHVTLIQFHGNLQ